MALVLLVGAALFTRSLWRLQHVDLGFNPDKVVTARLWLPQPNDPQQGRYFTHPARVALFDEVLRRTRSLPGVSGAAAALALPFDGTRNTASLTIEGHELDAQSRVPAVQTNIASAGYFELIGVRLLHGRTFTEQDNDHAPLVAVVTQTMAARYWPGENPVGRRVHFGGAQAKSPWLTVVGVVNDIRTGTLEEAARPTLFRPLRQASSLSLSIVMKASGDPRTLGNGPWRAKYGMPIRISRPTVSGR